MKEGGGNREALHNTEGELRAVVVIGGIGKQTMKAIQELYPDVVFMEPAAVVDRSMETLDVMPDGGATVVDGEGVIVGEDTIDWSDRNWIETVVVR